MEAPIIFFANGLMQTYRRDNGYSHYQYCYFFQRWYVSIDRHIYIMPSLTV